MLVSVYLLWWNVKSDGPQVNHAHSVGARYDEEQPCASENRRTVQNITSEQHFRLSQSAKNLTRTLGLSRIQSTKPQDHSTFILFDQLHKGHTNTRTKAPRLIYPLRLPNMRTRTRATNGARYATSLTLIVYIKESGKNKTMSSIEKAAST